MAKKEEEAPKTETYVLRQGQEHNGFDADGDRKLFVGGDRIQLTDNQYKAFKDKFDLEAELQLRARINSGGKVSREEALAALGITEEQFSQVAPAEETIKKPDGDDPKNEPIKVEPAAKEEVKPGVGSATSTSNLKK